MTELTDLQRDALREIGNVGSGNAITTLSNFIKIEIRQGLSFMDIIEVEKALMFMGGVNEDMFIINSLIEGDVSGTLLTVLPEKNGFILLDLLKKRDIGTTNSVTTEDLQLLISVGEAITDSYLATLVEFLGVSVKRGTAPVSLVDDTKKLMEKLKKDEFSNALMLETDFGIPDNGLEGDLVFLLNDNSIDCILNAVSRMMDK